MHEDFDNFDLAETEVNYTGLLFWTSLVLKNREIKVVDFSVCCRSKFSPVRVNILFSVCEPVLAE